LFPHCDGVRLIFKTRSRFQKDVLDHKPGLTVIQFGINDSAVDIWKDPPAAEPRVSRAQFALNLRHFIDRLREHGSQVILMTPNPLQWTKSLREAYGKPPYDPDQPDGFNILLGDYVQAVRDIAAEKRVPLVDVYKAFQEYEPTPGQSTGDLLSDGMHPNQKGHALVGRLLINEIVGLRPEPSAGGTE
jgi:lysophospholipase L1-like esterase